MSSPHQTASRAIPGLIWQVICLGRLWAVLVWCGSLPLSGHATEPPLRFTQAMAGLDFKHYNGATGEKLLPETMGSGLALVDFNGDGDLDLYFVNGASLDSQQPAILPTNALYYNTLGTFTKSPEAADTGYGMGVCAGDYDGDGDLDLYITNLGINRLYRNDGTRGFADQTTATGTGHPGWGTGCAWADLDGDGWLDLYVVNYLKHTATVLPRCIQDGRPFYCHPREYAAQADVLYRNRGTGRFEDISLAAGIADSLAGKGLGLAVFDYDLDGDLDLYIANDTTPNFLYRNDGGRFSETGEVTGTAYNEEARPEAGMGIAMGDIDRDGDPDMLVTNFEMETNTLYVNEGDDFFVDGSYAAGLGQPSYGPLGFGTVFLDADNDGDEDLFVANGHIQTDMRLHDGSVGSDQPDQLFRNNGSGYFADVSALAGSYFTMRLTSRGAAAGDYDSDGDLDLVISCNNQVPVLLRNDTAAQYTHLHIPGPVGLRARIVAAGRQQHKAIYGGTSYLSQQPLAIWFGLGTATRIDTLELIWPNGKRQVHTELTGNTTLDIPRPHP